MSSSVYNTQTGIINQATKQTNDLNQFTSSNYYCQADSNNYNIFSNDISLSIYDTQTGYFDMPTSQTNIPNQYNLSNYDSQYENQNKNLPKQSKFFGFYKNKIIILPYLIFCILLCLICLVLEIMLLAKKNDFSSIKDVDVQTNLIINIVFNATHIVIYLMILIFCKLL